MVSPCSSMFPSPFNLSLEGEGDFQEDLGDPLYLTDLLDLGRLGEAARRARVGPEAGFGQVNQIQIISTNKC